MGEFSLTCHVVSRLQSHAAELSHPAAGTAAANSLPVEVYSPTVRDWPDVHHQGRLPHKASIFSKSE